MVRCLSAFFITLTAFALVACETREVSRSDYNNPTYLTPIPTRIENNTPPSNTVIKSSGSNFDPLGDIGRGFAKLFPDKKPKKPSSATIQTRSADGQVNSLPPGYSGTSDYHSSDGNNYKLKFKDGTLIGVEDGGIAKKPTSEKKAD